ncbi:hypothetical protein EDB80DRAFT_595954 [Ilyonectria destructans]|nr:hypothetical protein EDB80DRAFT_595954 [Ilyonectria destructans]
MSADNSSASVLQLTIGSSVFTASVLDNPTVSAFISLLPLNLRMSDLNGNEKYADLSTSLPTAPTDPGSIRAGDLMLYNSRTLVLWYENYSTTYTYTRIGTIEDVGSLAAAVGGGQINVGFATDGGSEASPTVTGAITSAPPSNNQASRVGVSSYSRKVLWLTSFLALLHAISH